MNRGLLTSINFFLPVKTHKWREISKTIALLALLLAFPMFLRADGSTQNLSTGFASKLFKQFEEQYEQQVAKFMQETNCNASFSLVAVNGLDYNCGCANAGCNGIAQDAVYSSSVKAGQTLTYSHTTGTDANLMIVTATVNNNKTVTTAQYNGSNLVLMKQGSFDGRTLYVYIMINPPSGAHNVYISNGGSGQSDITVGSVTYKCVDTDNIFSGGLIEEHGQLPGVQVIGDDIECQGNNYTLDFLVTDDDNVPVGSGQTQVVNEDNPSNQEYLSTSFIPSNANPNDIGWTLTNSEYVYIHGCLRSCVNFEKCSNGIDDDGDGLVDSNDPDCPSSCILLTNTDLNTNLTGWATSGTVALTTDAYNGAKAVELTSSWATMSQTNSGITAGKVYTLSFNGKQEGSPSWIPVYLEFLNASNTVLSSIYLQPYSTCYNLYRQSSTAPPGATQVRVSIEKSGSGKLKLDEFCLKESTPAIGECTLIENSGFENSWIGWETWNTTLTNVTDVKSGSNALRLGTAEGSVYRQFGITPGETYELSAWSKVSGATTWAEIYFKWQDASGNTISDAVQPVNNTATTYTYFSLKGKAPSNAVYVEVGAYKSSGGYQYVDDFCFKKISPLGGTSFDLGCGCSDNLIPNGGYEVTTITNYPYTLDGKPAATIANGNSTSLYPWSAGISSPYIFLVNDATNTVNNPEGSKYVWLPNSGDCWTSNTDFSNNLLMEDGETYTFCFYAASRSLGLNGSGLPNGSVPGQGSGILALEFQFVSGFKAVNTWAVPASESATDLSWTKFEYTFTYDILDPISNFTFTNSRWNVGMYIDAVSLSKVDCPAAVTCESGGLSYDRWGSISGTSVDNLVSNLNYPNNYNETGFISSFQGPQNYSDDYGTRVYGYIVPPATGNYTFNVTGDDGVKLYLSTNASTLNKSLIAEVPGYSGVTEYTKYASQTSSTVSLVQDVPYYVELIHKEGTGGDHFQVYWKTPDNSSWNIIPGTALRPICSTEVCDNNRDDDFDGLTDCADPDCSSDMSGSYSVSPEACGVANGSISMIATGNNTPFSYRWSDMQENAWWTFEENTNDVSGNGNHNNGITGYPIYLSDAVQGNRSLYFNGNTAIRYSLDGGFMEIAATSLTVSLWIKPDNLSGTEILFEEGGSSNNSGIGLAIQLSNNQLQGRVKKNGSGNIFNAGSHTFPSDGNWHHVALVFDEGKVRLYLDGVAGSETTASFTSIPAHSNNGGIGGSNSGSVFSSSSNYYEGRMDDVRYYFNKALTDNQIADLAANDGVRNNLSAGNYSVTVSSASGCTISQDIAVTSGGNYTDGGTISGNESGCGSSFDPALITSAAAPSPGSGSTEYKWQSSTDNANWSDISNSDFATYDPSAISATTYYRRAARLLPCTGWVYSNSISKSKTANFTGGGAISADETKCGGYDPLVIIGTPPTSGTDVTWKVDPPVSGSANGAVYTITNQGGEPMFLTVTGQNVTKVTVKGGPVTATYTTPPFTGLTAPINPNNGTPYGISHFDIWVSGAVNGTAEYKWQQSIDEGTTWSDIPSSNAANYDPPFINATTLFKRGVRIAECSSLPGGGWLFTNNVAKTVELNITDPGIIVGDEENCGSFDPGIISSVTTPSGGAGGTLVYQWQVSNDGGSTWNNVSGATTATLDPITITTTTRYRRGAKRSTCGSFVYSNDVVKMVSSNFTSAGTISGTESYCTSYNPTIITSTSLPSGGIDGYTAYRWQKSTDNGATWIDLSGTGVDYDPVNTMTETTWYRRQTRRAPCSAWINSNTVVKEVKENPVSNIAFGPTTTNGYICEGVSYQFQAEDAGTGTNYSWNFGSYATPSTATGIGPHLVSFNVPNSNASTSVAVQLTVVKNSCPVVSTTNYSVRPPFSINSVSSTNPSSCSTPNGTITVNASSPSGTSLEASINGTTWVSSMNFTGLGPGNYDIWVRYSGDECMAYWGDRIIEEPSNPNPYFSYYNTSSACVGAIFTVQGSASSGSSVTWNFGTDAVPATATGLGPHGVYYTTGGVKTMRITATKNGCTGFEERNFTVISNHTDAGTIGFDEALCANGVPTTMSTITPPTGGYGGSTTYRWEQSMLLGNVWSAWSEINSTNNSSYSPGSISVSTKFRRKCRRGSCGSWIYSNEVIKTVTQTPHPSDDTFENACPGFTLVGYVGTNDLSLDNPIYSVETQPNNGFLDMDVDGEFYYIPNTTFCGGDQFTYQVCNSTTGCCATATAYIDMSDSDAPSLNNIPSDLEVSCDDEIPLPPVVDAFENCGNVWLSFDQTATQGADSCSIYSYLLTRVWTASDYCGNSQIDQQVITISDETAPDIYRIYTLPNGKRMIAGVMENVSHRWKTISFPIQFNAPPVVLAQVVTKGDNAAVATRLRNVSTSQFQLRLQEEEGADGSHGKESVAWIAIEKGSSSQGQLFEANTKLVSNVPVAATFNQSYPSPGFIGQIQTFNENNPATLRYNTLGDNSATIFCQEETSLDPEMNHGFETAGYFAFSGTGDVKNQAGEIIGETGQISVDHNALTINLTHRYHNPVVVFGGLSTVDAAPATIRVKNLTLSSFQVEVDEWDYLDGTHGTQALNYLVVEGSIPFDQVVECSEIPEKPIIGVDIAAVDNCDISTPLVITDSDWKFDCVNDTTMARTFYVRDECGNFTSLTQTFILRDTTPPTFTVPATVQISCVQNKDDLALTGDVTDENDNCDSEVDAVYTDNLAFQLGCSGYIIRQWSLSDHCGNTVTKFQTINVVSDNDSDFDGIPDGEDLDSDNDGIPDLLESHTDSDGDGVEDYLDLDSDNDGIPDIVEIGYPDNNGDGVIDNIFQPGWDDDNDGLGQGFDQNDNNPSQSASVILILVNVDPDGDGVPNCIDLDSDNDGIPDLIEAGGVDTDGNGRVDYPDDNPLLMEDSDGDGLISTYDPDETGLFTPDETERPLLIYDGDTYYSGNPSFNPDFDEDGVPDFHDLDSDNDGIPDLIEAGGIDTNGDGRMDIPGEFVDADDDGFHDNYASLPMVITELDGDIIDGRPEDTNNDGTVYLIGDMDNDSELNSRDTDADGDGIFDVVEITLGAYVSGTDGMIQPFIDNNHDGYYDSFASIGIITTDSDGDVDDGRPEDDGDPGTTSYNFFITDGTTGTFNGNADIDDDGDGAINSLDLDSDNDLLTDNLEDVNFNGVFDNGETNPLDPDSDNDGLLDGIEDTNLNGYVDVNETSPINIDTDGDLIYDGVEDINQNGSMEPGESNPADPCDPVLSTNCVGVALQVKVKLQGALIGVGNDTLMRDALREQGFLPNTEPYNEINLFRHAGEGGNETVDNSAFNLTGKDAVVDWIMIELRHESKPDSIVATKSVLLQRDGDAVMPNGDTVVHFHLVRSDGYFVGIRHRNHLGVITKNTQMLSPDPVLVDFTDPNTEVKGTYARAQMNGEMALWTGDLNSNRNVIYQGPFNDIITMFIHVIIDPDNVNSLANFVSKGYDLTDVDLDGTTVFQGPDNDRSKLLFNTTLSNGENQNYFANFVLSDKLPETTLPAAAPSCGDDKTVSSCDFDDDTVINDLDPDDDNDGVPDNYDLDPYNPQSDSDADGIKDIVETKGDGRYDRGIDSNPIEQDTDKDGIKDGVEDANKNGQFDANESSPIDICSPNRTFAQCDFDGDGILNMFDLDDDNDGVADHKDVADFDVSSDSDGDGIADGMETGNDGVFNIGTDTDPLNPCDPLSANSVCVPVDADGDGFYSNYPITHQQFDPNDENSCIPQAVGGVCPCEDTDGDGKIYICNKPGTDQQKTIKISIWLWPFYQSQGDSCGPCQQ